jgi:hypothetical protein
LGLSIERTLSSNIKEGKYSYYSPLKFLIYPNL